MCRNQHLTFPSVARDIENFLERYKMLTATAQNMQWFARNNLQFILVDVVLMDRNVIIIVQATIMQISSFFFFFLKLPLEQLSDTRAS